MRIVKNPTYTSIHEWVRRHKPVPEGCEECNKVGNVDAANISQRYKRDVDDWEYLCRSCHMKKDGRINNLNKGKFNRTYCKCGSPAVIHNGCCMKTYNYRRGHTKVPCSACQ